MKIKLDYTPPGVKLILHSRKDFVEIDLLMVREDLRGQGIGSRTVRAVQKLGREIRLTAVPDARKKTALHRFYRSLGFRHFKTGIHGFSVFRWLPQGGAK